MTAPHESELDAIILSFTKTLWLKTAFVIAKTLNECENRNILTTGDAIAARIASLCEAGVLKSQGNLSEWRESEIRLPTPT